MSGHVFKRRTEMLVQLASSSKNEKSQEDAKFDVEEVDTTLDIENMDIIIVETLSEEQVVDILNENYHFQQELNGFDLNENLPSNDEIHTKGSNKSGEEEEEEFGQDRNKIAAVGENLEKGGSEFRVEKDYRVPDGSEFGEGERKLAEDGNELGDGEVELAEDRNELGDGEVEFAEDGNKLGGGEVDLTEDGNELGGGEVELAEYGNELGDGEAEFAEEGSQFEGEELDEDDLSDNYSEGNQEEHNGRPRKGRKRKHPNQTGKTRKKLKNSNQSHFNSKNQKVNAKEFNDYHCRCQCNGKVSVGNRKSVFKTFWELGDYDKQNLFISSLISEEPIKRKRAQGSERRQFTREYKLNNVVVCRNMFVKALGISTKRVNTAMKKLRSQELTDQRGKNGTHNKVTEERIEEVRNHINKIPRYKSHYCRTTTDTCFIPPEFTLPKMYELYKQEVHDPVSQSKYNKVFYTDFNLKRKPLKKDTCSTCDSFKARIDCAVDNVEKEILKKEHENHLQLVETVRNAFKSDMQLAQSNALIETATFDLQKTLPLPRIPTNVVYYKRQVMMYNCGVHSGKSKKGHFYVWVENVAGRGAQEIGSCLAKHIMEKCLDIEELVLWSDSCGGQNRNIKITLMLKHILKAHPTLKKITLKFLVPGHSFLPNDSEFGDVESHLKTVQRIYTDQDYIEIMKSSRKKNPFIVNKMTKTDFHSTQTLELNITNRKSDVNEAKINWFKFREIQILKTVPFSIFIKTNLQENYQEINIFKKAQRGRPCSSEGLFSENLNLLWPEGKGISQPKMKDLKSMLHLIPKDAKAFYKQFFPDSSIVDDIEGFNAEIDFDLQFED